jgi:hypothetical protein
MQQLPERGDQYSLPDGVTSTIGNFQKDLKVGYVIAPAITHHNNDVVVRLQLGGWAEPRTRQD